MYIIEVFTRDNVLAAKQQRKIFCRDFFKRSPLLELYAQSHYNVEGTLTLTGIPQQANICNDSNGLLAVCDESVPMSKLMIRRDLDLD